MDVSAAVSFMKKKSKRSLCVVLSTSVLFFFSLFF